MISKPTRQKIIKTSQQQESRTAATYRGSRNAGSGSHWKRKNDVRTDNLLIENKFTTNSKQITLKFVDLRDLEKQAVLDDRMPVLQFDLGGKKYVVLTEDDFLEMIHAE